jgi:hypothetical protein
VQTDLKLRLGISVGLVDHISLQALHKLIKKHSPPDAPKHRFLNNPAIPIKRREFPTTGMRSHGRIAHTGHTGREKEQHTYIKVKRQNSIFLK